MYYLVYYLFPGQRNEQKKQLTEKTVISMKTTNGVYNSKEEAGARVSAKEGSASTLMDGGNDCLQLHWWALCHVSCNGFLSSLSPTGTQ